MGERAYLCIDLKSFYASVECVERGLDPMKALLVVADPERSDKTICLAVSPAMKALGVKNRCRVFEIPKNISYIMAPPRMQKYIDYAAAIYGVYLRKDNQSFSATLTATQESSKVNLTLSFSLKRTASKFQEKKNK